MTRRDELINIIPDESIDLVKSVIDDVVFLERRLTELKGLPCIEVNPKNNITKIKSGLSEFSIQGLDAEEYPSVPTIEAKFKFKIEFFQKKDEINERKNRPFSGYSGGDR